MAYKDLREYLAALEVRGKLHHVKKEVDPNWEVAAVIRRVFQRIPPARRPAVMFEHVKGHRMPLVAGILGASPEVYALALETTVDQIADKWSRAQSHPIPPVRVKTGPVKDVIQTGERIDATALPLCLWTRDQDPAPYVTGPCVISVDPETGERNMGTYRLMLKGPRKFGLFLSTTWRDMYAHLMKNERKGNPTPCAVVIGCDPPVPLTSVARIRGDELGVAGALRGEPLEVVKCETNDLEVPAHAEIVIEGFVPAGVREHEGPFGEYTGVVGPELRDRGHGHHAPGRPDLPGLLQPDAAQRVELHPRHRPRCGAAPASAPRSEAPRARRAPARGRRRRRVPGDLTPPRASRPAPAGAVSGLGVRSIILQVGGRGRRGHRHPRLLPGPLGHVLARPARARSLREPRHGRRRARPVDRGGGRGPAPAQDRALVQSGRRRDAEASLPRPLGAPEGGSRPGRRPLGGLRPGVGYRRFSASCP